jgi:2-polyprenyl-6-methoxyphenol hydroxylase-like FAD-dependent oxidoreductase
MLDEIIHGGNQRPTQLDKGPGFVFGGHFAGMMLNANKINFSQWKYHPPGPAFLPGRSSLGRIEGVLSERAQTLGVQTIRGMRVTKVSDEGDTVKVWAGDECFEAQWLIGCDGGRSTVRKSAGFQFEGTGSEFMGYIASCDLDNQELLKPGFNRTESGMYIDTGPGQIYAVDFDLSFDRSQPVTREHFQTVLQRVSGLDITVKALHLTTTFTDRSKQATEYRRGRVSGRRQRSHPLSTRGAGIDCWHGRCN